MRYEKGNFITVPNRKYLQNLSATAQALFVWICNYADDDGICFPSRSTLAKKLNTSDRTVDTYLKELEEKGFIKKTNRFYENEKISNEYQLLIIEGGSEKSSLGSEKNDPTPSEKSSHRTKTNITKSILSEQSSQGEIVKVKDDQEERVFSKRKTTNKEVLRVLGMFSDTLGVDTTGWGVNKTQRTAISNLLSRGKDDPFKTLQLALNFVKEHREDQYMKWIFSPDDLDKNWNRIKFYRDKL